VGIQVIAFIVCEQATVQAVNICPELTASPKYLTIQAILIASSTLLFLLIIKALTEGIFSYIYHLYPCGICGGQSVTQVGVSLPVLRFSPTSYHYTNAPYTDLPLPLKNVIKPTRQHNIKIFIFTTNPSLHWVQNK
jgi:hypothetical protein